MQVDNTSLFLIFTAISVVLIVLFTMATKMLIEGRHKSKSRLEENSKNSKQTPHECSHSLGYLSKYPRDQPIPDECFGCHQAMDCLQAQSETAENPPADCT